MDNNICVPLYSLWYFQNLLKCPQNNLAGIAIEAGKTLLEKNKYIYVQFSSVAQSCLTLCDPMNRSMPGLPVHHQLLEFTQTHVH